MPYRRLGAFVLAATLALIPVYPVLAAPKQHRVTDGESLWSIARRYGVSVDSLQRANGLSDANRLSLNQVLRIPETATAPASARTGGVGAPVTRSTVHRVRPGDSLWSVARRYGTTPDRLASANGIRETATLSLGQPLRVPGRPGTSQQAGVATAAARPLSGSFDTIRIRGGDTLWSLSRRYGTTPAKIAALNGIREDATLQLNQAVKVPAVSRNEPAAKTPAVGSSSQDKRTANSAASQTQTAQIAAVRPERRATTASSRGSLISGIARRFLGTPYLWGGTGNGGFDCSGFIYSMYNRMGVRLPRTSFAMFNVGRSVPRSALRPGDLVFFTTYAPGASHAGIYIGGGSFVHASSAGRGVRIDALSKSYYNARFLGARRHL